MLQKRSLAVFLILLFGALGYFFRSTTEKKYTERETSDYIKLTYSIDFSNNPADAITSAQYSWNRLIYNTLIYFDAKMVVQPGLAESWTFDPSGRHLEFKLKKDSVFNDGSPVTATDVVESLKYLVNKSINRSQFSIITNIRSVNKYSVILDIKRPSPLLIPMLASSLAVVRKASDVAVGSGPFTFIERDENCLILKSSPYKNISIKKMKLCSATEGDAIRALKDGKAHDMIDIFINQNLNEYSTGRARQVHVESTYTWILALNLNIPPLDDIKFRHCLDANFDRTTFVSMFVPAQRPAFTIVPKLSAALEIDAELHTCEVYQKKYQIEISVPEEVEHSNEICDFLKKQIGSLGATAKCFVRSFSKILSDLRSGRHQIALLAIGLEIPSLLYPFSFFSSFGPFNVMAKSDREIERLLARSSIPIDSMEISRQVDKLNERIRSLAFSVPISSAGHQSLVLDCVDINLSPLGPSYIDYGVIQLNKDCRLE